MKLRHVIVLLTILVVAGYSFIAVRMESGDTLGIEINLAKPALIVWPCEISYVGDHGEQGFRIPPKVGRGWKNEAGGTATYKFFVPNKDKYYVWAYSKWYDVCTNAIYASIDGMEKTIIGNDPVYNQWHWVRGFPIVLGQGTHTLILSNHSDNVELQKICLINTNSAGPETSKVTFSDLFYDGFDGCDQGNYLSWKVIKGNWRVMDPLAQSCKFENALKGVSEDEAMIVYTDDTWDNYSLDVELEIESFQGTGSEVGICFGLKDVEHFYSLSIVPKEESTEVDVILTNYSSGAIKKIGASGYTWDAKKRHTIQIKMIAEGIEFNLDNHESRVIAEPGAQIKGGVGFYLKGKIVAYFDNVHVRKITQAQSGRHNGN